MEEVRFAIGVATTIGLLFITGTMIFSIVVLSNARKKTHEQEKENLQQQFREEILQTQLEVQEQTFNSISQEIHDNVGQTLSLVKVQLNIIQQTKTLDMAMIADARECVGKAMTDLRDIANSMNTKRVEQSTLAFLAENELQKIKRLGLFQTAFTTEGEEKPIKEKKKLVIFRIVQEALQNVMKHSKARNITVGLKYEKESLTTTVIDDGIGFDVSNLPAKAGLGLQNLLDRASLIGGEAHIFSELHNGTKIIIMTPYE